MQHVHACNSQQKVTRHASTCRFPQSSPASSQPCVTCHTFHTRVPSRLLCQTRDSQTLNARHALWQRQRSTRPQHVRRCLRGAKIGFRTGFAQRLHCLKIITELRTAYIPLQRSLRLSTMHWGIDTSRITIRSSLLPGAAHVAQCCLKLSPAQMRLEGHEEDDLQLVELAAGHVGLCNCLLNVCKLP